MSVVTENPRGTCVLGGINNVLSALYKVCPIYHSGPGCCMQTSAGEAGQAGLRGPYYLSGVSTPCSNMLEREVIFGGADKLRDEIEGALEIIDAEAYFVLTGCTAGIIGDDLSSITREYSNRGLPVYPITTPGFAGNSLLGYEVVFQTFLDEIVEEKLPRQPDVVNLLGIIPYHDPHWTGTLEELTRIFRRLGLRVNTFFTEDQGMKEIRNSSSAALNIIVNPWLLKGVALQYEKRFNVPFLRFPGLPIGVTETTRLVKQTAEFLGLDKSKVEKVIHEEESYVYHFMESIIGGLSWKQFAVVGDAATAVGMTRFLANDYSFTPVLTIVTDPIYREEDRQRITDQITDLEYARPPALFFESDHYQIMQKLREYDQITLLVGSSLEQEIAIERNIQCHVMSFPVSDRLVLNRTYSGYRGCLTLVEDLFNNL
ncbi:MAG: nitrogenase molybdenum-iron protein, alpha and beta chain [Spirochaetaceae bacterium]|nr:nitrogenase molybdenum-iron protein, alpha and beta chain [Spirochaetaceae bacterium]